MEPYTEAVLWIVIVGFIIAFILAFGIGAKWVNFEELKLIEKNRKLLSITVTSQTHLEQVLDQEF